MSLWIWISLSDLCWAYLCLRSAGWSRMSGVKLLSARVTRVSGPQEVSPGVSI